MTNHFSPQSATRIFLLLLADYKLTSFNVIYSTKKKVVVGGGGEKKKEANLVVKSFLISFCITRKYICINGFHFFFLQTRIEEEKDKSNG